MNSDEVKLCGILQVTAEELNKIKLYNLDYDTSVELERVVAIMIKITEKMTAKKTKQ